MYLTALKKTKKQANKQLNCYAHKVWSIGKEILPVRTETEKSSTSVTWTSATRNAVNWFTCSSQTIATELAKIRCFLDSSHIWKWMAIPKV